MTALAVWLAQDGPEAGELAWPLIATGVLAVLTTITLLVRTGRRSYRSLREWVQRTATAAEETAHAVATSNGHTTGELMEQVARDVTALTDLAAENRDIALQARTLAEQANARLDAHLIGHTE